MHHSRLFACALPYMFAMSQGATAAGFVEDSTASLTLRNFYFDNNIRNASTPSQEQWGQGFMLNLQSGYTQGPVGFGVDAIGLLGIKLDDGGHVGKAGGSRVPAATGLFPVDGDGTSLDDFSSVGLTGKVKYSKTEFKVGTFIPKLPIAYRNDGRLVPQTFEGWQIQSRELDKLTLLAGRFNNARGRASSDNHPLSIVGSNNATTGQFSDRFYYAGAEYQASQDLLLQYYVANLENFYTQNYLGAVYDLQLPVGKLRTDIRLSDSASSGKNGSAEGRLVGYRASGYWGAGDPKTGEMDNRTWSSLFTYLLGGHAAGLGYQKMTGNSQYAYLNQGDGSATYLITEKQINPFNNPGERSWLAQYTYDFAAVGIPGLTSAISYTAGDHIQNAAGELKEWERDIEVGYILQSGSLKGLAVILRNGMFRSDLRGDIDQNRLIFSYTLPLF